MLHYDVFTQADDGLLHYGSRRYGVTATSKTLGLGPREVALIADAHDLGPRSVIHCDNSWIVIQAVRESLRPGWPCEVDYDYLPAYHDPSITFGGEEWSHETMQRLRAEAYAMRRQ